MIEENIYADDSVAITTARVTVSGTTYAVRNITSVRMTETSGPIEIDIKYWLVGGGLGLVVAGWLFFILTELATKLGYIMLTGGAVAFVVGVFMAGKPRSLYYNVVITTSGGEISVFTSLEHSRIRKIIEGIQQAIVRHR